MASTTCAARTDSTSWILRTSRGVNYPRPISAFMIFLDEIPVRVARRWWVSPTVRRWGLGVFIFLLTIVPR